MDILTLLLMLSVSTLICAWLYTQDFMKKVVFDKSVHLSQVFTAIVPTSIFIIFFLFSYISIISNSKPSDYTFLDNFVLILLVLFSAFALMGLGIHFTGKCLSENLKNSQNREVRRSSYLFHILLGHHITFILGVLALLLMAIFNFYHPAVLPASLTTIYIVVAYGFLWALSWAFGCAYAPIKRTIYIYLGGISCVVILVLFISDSLSINHFIYSIFFFSTIFFSTTLISLVRYIERLKKKHIRLIWGKGKSAEELNHIYYKENF